MKVIKNLVRKVIPESMLLRREVRRQLGDYRDLVLIHQMGKVGSSAVLATLKGLSIPVIQTHFLSEKGIRAAKKWHLANGATSIPYNIRYAEELRKELPRVKNIKIVSLVREPVAREISGYFQYGRNLFEGLRNAGLLGEDRIGQVISDIEANVELLRDQECFFNRWFEWEMNTVFGIDVFAEAFDESAGWARFCGEKAEVLLIRTEDLSEVWSQAAADFFGRGAPVELKRANVGIEKRDGDLYQQIKQRVRFRPETIEDIYCQRTVSHFYSESERAAFTKKWRMQ